MRTDQIIDVCGYQFLDRDNVRWLKSELLQYIASAQLQIVHLKPDALSNTVNILLQAEKSLQNTPQNSIRLLNVIRNVNEDNDGKTITQTTLKAMNESYPAWPEDLGPEIKHWMYDPENDRGRFYVYPRPEDAINLECVVALRPKLTLTISETLELEDQWYNQVVDYVLWRAYSKDADYNNVSPKAQYHLNTFFDSMGLTHQSNISVNTGAMIRGQGDGEL